MNAHGTVEIVYAGQLALTQGRVGEVITSCFERNVEFKGAEIVNVTGDVPSLIVFQDEWVTVSMAAEQSGRHGRGERRSDLLANR